MSIKQSSPLSLPEEVASTLSAHGIELSQVVLFEEIDLQPNQRYGKGWVCATEKSIAVLNPGSNGNGASHDFQILDYKETEEIKIESLVTSGLLSAKMEGGEDRLLCRFSNSRTKALSRFTRIVGKLKKGEELSEKDLQEEQQETTCPKCGRRYHDQARKICPKCLDKGSVLVRLLKYFSGHSTSITIILVCMVAQAVLELFSPYLNGRIFFDEVLNPAGKYYGKLVPVFGLMVGIRLIAIGVSVIYGRRVSSLSARVVYRLKTDIFAAMQKLSLGFFTSKQTGGLMNRVNYDAMRLEFFFVEGVPFFFVSVFILIGITATMLWMNWLLALMVLLPAPLLIIISKKLLPRIWSLYSRRYRSSRFLKSVVNDSLTGVRVVKAFGRESAEIDRFDGANIGVFSANVAAQKMSSTAFPIIHFVMQLGGFVVWVLGGWKVVQGQLSFGALMTFVGYIAMFYRPLQFFTQLLDFYSWSMNSAQRIFEIIDAKPDVIENPNPVRLPAIEGNITVENVTFAYEPNNPVLHNVSLEIKAGEMIGLVGHTGAGKSTITNIITRLYDVEDGKITIDGVDVKDAAMADLRAQIGIVLQTTYLFHGSISQNIAYARPDASREEIVQAAKAANAHDFIAKLPDGYDTRLGRQGQDLSGGERQRIAVARAILKSPRILVFDEATSSVDTETEEKIQQAIERLVEGRTTIAIAHRLSTLRRADRLFIVEKGRIVETGSHKELMLLRGKYHELVSREHKALKVIGVSE